MNKIWRYNLNQRKQAFWNMLKNENTSVIYVDWFSTENAIIPKKFQSKMFANEPEELKKIKEALSLEKMKAQAKLHHAVAVRNKAKFEEKEREMLNEIEKISSVHVRQQLQGLWRNDYKKQEIPLIVEIVATESRNNEERRDNSETQFKIIVNKEVDHRKGTLTVTVETTAGFVTIIVPVRIMIGAPVGQITTGGLF